MSNNKKKILITGHTGFIGSWLFYFLKKKNFDVHGVGLKPDSKNNLYYELNLNKDKKSKILNILNYKKLENYVKQIKPQIIIHLAAESLVLRSIIDPDNTYKTNILGTLNILKLFKDFKFLKSGIFFTTDKVYKNLDKKKKFKENDSLGGDDPYSGSKSASELVINSFVKTFLSKKKIIILRCGNIIGGGDISKFRIIPDIIKCILTNKKLIIRNPDATRPWQHILDVINIVYAIILKLNRKKYIFETFNTSPYGKSVTVKKLILKFEKEFKFSYKTINKKNIEKKKLELNSLKLFNFFKIKNTFSSIQAINNTIKFYKKIFNEKKKIIKVINEEIMDYERKTKNL